MADHKKGTHALIKLTFVDSPRLLDQSPLDAYSFLFKADESRTISEDFNQTSVSFSTNPSHTNQNAAADEWLLLESDISMLDFDAYPSFDPPDQVGKFIDVKSEEPAYSSWEDEWHLLDPRLNTSNNYELQWVSSMASTRADTSGLRIWLDGPPSEAMLVDPFGGIYPSPPLSRSESEVETSISPSPVPPSQKQISMKQGLARAAPFMGPMQSHAVRYFDSDSNIDDSENRPSQPTEVANPGSASKAQPGQKRRNGQLRGFNVKTGELTLVGRFPPIVQNGIFQCPDARCQAKGKYMWNTQNGYKYHVRHVCPRNPDRVKSKKEQGREGRPSPGKKDDG